MNSNTICNLAFAVALVGLVVNYYKPTWIRAKTLPPEELRQQAINILNLAIGLNALVAISIVVCLGRNETSMNFALAASFAIAGVFNLFRARLGPINLNS